MQKTYTKKKLGSYPSIGVILSVTLALFVTGLFGMLVIYSQQFEKIVRENIRLEVYLKNGLTETQRMEIEKKLESLEYISKEGFASNLQFVSKDDAAKRFIAETGEDFTNFLGDNPLHDAFLVSIDPAFHSKSEMEKIKVEIEKMSGIFQVVPKDSLIESVNKNATRIGLILLGLSSILILAVVLLINNTIRLALFSQRFLIRSMQLVGAKRWFILKPFLFRAIGYGLLAGFLASLIVYALINYANKEIEDLALLMNEQSMLILMGSLLFLGMFVAFISTYFSIRRYLKMSLDELY